ncbi:MAG: twin-arginine translocase TatA/TatE family subunit [Deltaproteobacteria bacterium]|nr:twin-arginine translocase TatA/TatE family subunit [Deltaproteobacteria bacterium]
MGSIGLPEILVVLLIAFVIFGAKRLPELGAGLGKAIRSFNKGVRGEDDQKESASIDEGKSDGA